LISNLVVTTLGKLECEDLPIEDCAFSVASTGTRCVLETYEGKDGSIHYECQSSLIMAEKQEEWIESDECINACGLERMSVGLSTDLLLDSHFADMFCSSECLNNCPNLIDLYISLAAGEGMYLPQLCKTHRTRRVIPDPVKKAMDAEYLRSLLPKFPSTDAMAPGASPIPETGSWLPKGPDYRGYGGPTSGNVVTTTRGEELPEVPAASPVAGSDSTPPPLQQAPSFIPTVAQGPSTSKRPFFFISPTPSATITEQSDTQSGTQSEVGQSTESATAPAVQSLDQDSELDVSWQQELTKLPDRHHLSEEDQYLYQTYFH
jgi:hypothetical protein